MTRPPLFARILPDQIINEPVLYVLAVILFSVITAFVAYLILLAIALPAAWLVSEALQAGMGGMAITLLFVLGAATGALAVLLVLLWRHLRRQGEWRGMREEAREG
ncbi:MAG: hypothetical protein EA403_01770 [Spirochaetaceae bacterium]|nr:MAG: hypothetical protein EA403_01770 [Spirochaetaceae bacterium]